MGWASPLWLWGLLALPVIWLWLQRAGRRQAAELAALGDPELVAELARGADVAGRGRRRRWRLWALAMLILALARPQWGQQAEEIERSGRQVMLVLDVSTSMMADDLAPDRLQRARLEIQALLERIRGDQAGLVLFSGAAFTQVPLTVDHGLLVNMLDLAGPQTISRPGTSIGAAIDTAARGFDQQRLADRAILLFSDGEDPLPGAIEAAERAREGGSLVFTVGLGSPEGARVPELDASGRRMVRQYPDGREETVWILDDAGEPVVSRLDESVLGSIAEAGGGRYIRAERTGQAAAELADALAQLERGEIGGQLGAQPNERFQWPLALALVLLLLTERGMQRRLEAVTTGLRQGRGPRDAATDVTESSLPSPSLDTGALRISRAVVLLLLLLPALSMAACGGVSAINDQANQAFDAEDWRAAEALYREALEADPDRAELLYNLGNAAYRQSEVEEARRLLRQALEEPSLLEETQVWYNLGTLALNAGELEAAVAAFQAVLRQDPEDQDARHNLELALAALTATPPAQASSQPSQAPESGTPTPTGGSPSPGTPSPGSPSPGSATPQGSPEPGGSPQPGQDGEPTGTPPADGQPGEPGRDATAEASEAEPNGTLTPEQAERLLESLARDLQTLQERLNQIYVVPGEPPAQRW